MATIFSGELLDAVCAAIGATWRENVDGLGVEVQFAFNAAKCGLYLGLKQNAAFLSFFSTECLSLTFVFNCNAIRMIDFAATKREAGVVFFEVVGSFAKTRMVIYVSSGKISKLYLCAQNENGLELRSDGSIPPLNPKEWR